MKKFKNFFGDVTKRKKSFVWVLMLYLVAFIYGNKQPIVLFVGQHFSGSLFKSIHLSI